MFHCSHCHKRLIRNFVGKFPYYHCHSCESSAVFTFHFHKLFDGDESKQLNKAIVNSSRNSSRKCIICEKPYKLFHWHNVELETCAPCHVLWFDKDEMNSLDLDYSRFDDSKKDAIIDRVHYNEKTPPTADAILNKVVKSIKSKAKRKKKLLEIQAIPYDTIALILLFIANYYYYKFTILIFIPLYVLLKMGIYVEKIMDDTTYIEMIFLAILPSLIVWKYWGYPFLDIAPIVYAILAAYHHYFPQSRIDIFFRTRTVSATSMVVAESNSRSSLLDRWRIRLSPLGILVMIFLMDSFIFYKLPMLKLYLPLRIIAFFIGLIFVRFVSLK
jgi:Zn-finger nucleic acid-binding protein